MIPRWAVAFLVVALTAAQAQDQPGGPGREPPRAREKLHGRDGPAPMFGRLARRLTEELDLSERQQAELGQIVTDFRARVREMPGPSAEARELMARWRETRARGGGRGNTLREFFEEVETILEPPQREKLADFQRRMGQFMREGSARRGEMRRVLEALPETLGLDEGQRARFEELRAQLREQGGGRWQGIGPLMEELRQAEANGDEQRAQETREELDRLRSAGSAALDTFFDELANVLRKDQKAKLAEVRAQITSRQPPGDVSDVRRLLQAARRLDLDEGQEASLREITQAAGRAVRELDRRDAEGHATLASDVKRQVTDILRPEQVQEFERLLQGARPHRHREGARTPGSPGAGEDPDSGGKKP